MNTNFSTQKLITIGVMMTIAVTMSPSLGEYSFFIIFGIGFTSIVSCSVILKKLSLKYW